MAPKVLALEIETLKLNRVLTRRNLELTSRGLALAVMTSLDNYNLSVKKEDYYKKSYEGAMLQYDLGQISKSELMMSEISYLDMKNNQEIAARSLEDNYLAMNQLLGYDLKNQYSIKKEDQYSVNMKAISFYIDLAMEQRLDLKMITKTKEVNKEMIKFYTYGHYLDYVVNRDAYDNLVLKGSELDISLELKIDDIKKQLYDGYTVLEIKSRQVEQLKKTLIIQENEYNISKEKMLKGKTNGRALEVLEFNLINTRNNLSSAIYDFNTNHLSFIHLTYYGSINGGGMR